METSNSNFFLPNRMGRIIFLASEEILGRNGLNAILHLAGLSRFIENYPPKNQQLGFSFENISTFQHALENFYGPHGGRGVAQRIGRASFPLGMREFGPALGLTDLGFRLLPLNTRVKIGSIALADVFNKNSHQLVRIEDKEKELLWHIERCPLCWNRHSDSTSCQMTVGLIQEALYWVSGGKFYSVEENLCMARGDSTCTIVIEKTPLS